MAKNIRRMLAMVLVMCMFASALPMQALAAEGDGTVTEGPIAGTTSDGVPTSTIVTTTTTTTDGSNGTPTVTVEIKETSTSISGSNNAGAQVEGTASSSTTTVTTNGNADVVAESSESYIETTTTTENGSSSHYVAEGSDWSKETVSVPLPEGGVTVEVPTTEGSSNTESFGDPAGTQNVIDGKKPGEGDTNYEYTETTVIEASKVTVETTKVETKETFDKETLDKNDLEYVKSETIANGDITKLEGTNDLVLSGGPAPEEYLPGYEGDPVVPEGVEGYDYVYVGAGNTSMLVPAIVFDKDALTDEEKLERWGNDAYLKYAHRNYSDMVPDGVTVVGKDAEGYALDAAGNRIVRREMSTVGPDGKTYYLDRIDRISGSYLVEGWYEDGEWVKELNGQDGYYAVWAGPQQFTLVDKDGKIITTYCADSNTPTEKTFGYNIENLEDATYYSSEEAEQIRSIALNGYWGTVGNETDADGNEILDENGKPIPKKGSLEAMKASLLASGKFTETELESLTDGVALTATQMAIWSNSNKMSGIQFINAHYSEWGIPDYYSTTINGKPNPNYNQNILKKDRYDLPTEKEDEVDLMFRIYNYLINLAPTPSVSENEEATTENTIINADNFLKSMDITVIQKDDSHDNNKDDIDTNDAYTTTLTFSLAVVPSGNENDDLVVYLYDADGNVKATGRIAGEKKDGEIDMRDVKDNNYAFENITMIEGNQKFTLNLSGIQHLKEGVYLYTSEVRDGTSSQTLVGLAGGDRGFNVTMDIEFTLNVDDAVVATEHVWHYEGDPSNEHNFNTPVPTNLEPEAAPQVFRLANQNVEEIPEEPVPLAAPVITGDNSGLWIAVILLSVFAMAAINLFDKKRQHEAF